VASQFGPWATLIDLGGSPQLSAFWRRRMRMLAPTSRAALTLSRRNVCWIVVAGALVGLLPTFRPAQAAAAPADKQTNGTFLVYYRGYALLGPDGKEKQRLESRTNGAGALSPDGKWVAFAGGVDDESHGAMVIQSRSEPHDRTRVQLIWGKSGTSFLPIWSSDSKRILICERGRDAAGDEASRYRVYDLAAKSFSELKVPSACWVNDWSADGKRLLTTVDGDKGNSLRIAWVNADGTGQPAYITSENEEACLARLSPDGTRVLCKLKPKLAKGEESKSRLCVIELATNKRTIVGEPGAIEGYCWAADGSRIAYTWQRSPAARSDANVRETQLITCNADGSNRKIITSRIRKAPESREESSGVVIYFEVLDWR
jgi:hypothetical protein